MPFRRRRIKRATMGKDPIKHSRTVVSVIGNGSMVTQNALIVTNVGDRSLDGTAKVIQDQASTANLVMVSTVVKYLNIVLQAATTEAGNDQNTQTQGWIEWAIVFREEVDIPIPVTEIGTRTLGDIAMQMFRGDCLLTGQFPVSVNLPNVERIVLKLPNKAIKWKIGQVLSIYMLFRDAETTDLQTDTVKVVQSAFFKAYN